MSLDYLIEHVGVEPPVFGESHSSVRFTSLYRLLRIIVSFCYGKQGVVGCPTHGMELKNSTHVLKHGTRIIYTTLLRIRT